MGKLLFAAIIAPLLIVFAAANANAAQPPVAINGFSSEYVSNTVTENHLNLLRTTRTDIIAGDYVKNNHPALAAAIDKYMADEAVRAAKEQKDMVEAAKEQHRQNPQYFYGYSFDNRVTVNRADTVAFSMLVMCGSYTGGAHGMYGILPENYDTATGKKLALGDVFADKKLLADTLTERIVEKYGDGLFENPAERIAEAIEKNYTGWSLDYDGATFYFNPYHLAPYAAGVLRAKVFFDFDKNLFKEKYAAAPHKYAYAFGEETVLSLKGQMTHVNVTTYKGECRVKVGDGEFSAPGDYEDGRGIFIKSGDKYFLWVDALNGGTKAREILVYDITKGITPRGVLKRTFLDPQGDEERQKQIWLTNPDGFTIYKNVPRPGETPTDIGSVGEDGKLVFG